MLKKVMLFTFLITFIAMQSVMADKVINTSFSAGIACSTCTYTILVYQNKSEIRTAYSSTRLTFIDNSEPISLRYRLYHLFDESNSIEYPLLVAFNKKFTNAYFVDSSKIAIILNEDFITGIKLI